MLKILRSHVLHVATLLLLVQAGVYYSMSRTEVIPDTLPWSQFPTQLGAWKTVSESEIEPDIVAKLQPDDYIVRDYATDAGRVSLFIGYFKTQRKGLAPHSPKACLPSAGWEPVSAEVHNLDIPGQSVPVNHYVVQKQNSRMFVLYWYQQDKRSFANEIAAQFYAVPELFVHGRTDIALVRIIVPMAGDRQQEAADLATQFARLVYPAVRNQIP